MNRVSHKPLTFSSMQLHRRLLMRTASCMLLLCLPLFSFAQELKDGIAAIVNDEVIALSELKAELRDETIRLKARYRGKELHQRLIQKEFRILNILIERKLQLQEAKSKGLSVSDEEVEAALQNMPLPPGMPFHNSQTRKRAREDLILQKLLNFEVRRLVMVSPEEIRMHYEENTDRFMEVPRYRLRQILFLRKPDKGMTTILAQANEVYEKLQSGQDFSELAQLYSEGPEGARGGDLGSIPQNELLTELSDRLENMEVGQVSVPFTTHLGVHIIILDDIERPQVRPFDEVKDQINSHLYQTKTEKTYQEWIAHLKEKAYIDIKL